MFTTSEDLQSYHSTIPAVEKITFGPFFLLKSHITDLKQIKSSTWFLNYSSQDQNSITVTEISKIWNMYIEYIPMMKDINTRQEKTCMDNKPKIDELESIRTTLLQNIASFSIAETMKDESIKQKEKYLELLNQIYKLRAEPILLEFQDKNISIQDQIIKII